MIENRQLRYFVTAARLLHITRAAEALHIAQPALTRNIHQLEEELGVALFHRVHKRISLTEAGQTFLGEAERLLQQLEESATAAQKAARGELGRLVIGFVSTAGLVAVPKLIADFRNRYPGPRIVLKELESEELYEALRNGVVDVGLQYGPWEEGELSVRLLEADHFVAALPHDHRLATVDRVNLRDLADDFFVIPNRATGGPMTDAIVEECLLAGFRPRTGHDVKMNRQQGAELGFAATAQAFADFHGVKIESGGLNIGEDGPGPGAHDGAGRREKAERRGENAISGLHSCSGQGQPDRVGPGGTSYSLARTAEICHFALELLHLRTQHVVLRGAHPPHSLQNFRANLLILALQIEHGNGFQRQSAWRVRRG